MGALFTFLLGLSGRSVALKVAELGFTSSLELAKFLAWKALIYTILFVAIQVVVSQILFSVFDTIFSYASSVASIK